MGAVTIASEAEVVRLVVSAPPEGRGPVEASGVGVVS